jgi:triphosphoribosyl-dephospho-CoA synthase
MKNARAFALAPGAVAAVVCDACMTEVRAFKPGNVSMASPGHGMLAEDFIVSAQAMCGALTAPAAGVGQRILRAIEATRSVVPFNTNLGIVLLCAPLVHAATARMEEPALRLRLHATLDGLDLEDAGLTYRAIRLAQPGGLGRSAKHDITQPPQVTLREAMQEARERDRVAYQYVTDYRDVFATGLPAVREGLNKWGSREWATVYTFLDLLGRHPDSHIARKHGRRVAVEVSAQARELSQTLGRSRDPASEMPALEALDQQWKARSINPGTSADLTVAALVTMDLEDSLEREESQLECALSISE